MKDKDTKKMKKHLSAIVSCLVYAALFIICNQTEDSYAYTTKSGVVNDGPVKVRKTPVDGDKIVALNPESTVLVVSEEKGSDGKLWYKIQFTRGSKTYEGYIRSDFVTLTENAGTANVNTESSETSNTESKETQSNETSSGDAQPGEVISNETQSGESAESANVSVENEYYQSLLAAGFPESYCAPLVALHEKYPKWRFVAVQTGLDWNTSVEKESVVGKNLVQSLVNDARKSTESSAYNWSTNTWYGFDGANWVSASKEYIAYCMDPRNFLDETYIFQFETLEYADYQTVEGVENILKGTFMSGKYKDTDGKKRSYAKTFFEIGKDLAVSPYHLASRGKQEQGVRGTSQLISGNYSGYQGYYNYFNVNAYTTSSASATVNGLAYAKKMGWNSIYKSISGGSEIVANRYVKKGQNTTYFEKFNVVNKSSLYSHQYMTNVMAAISEGSSISRAYSDKSGAFVFRIPVYQNMPAQAVGFSDTGNPNNWLSKVEITGCNLTPSFKASVTDYSVIVGKETDTIDVKATAVANKSTISGIGSYNLAYGSNTILLTCTSQSGKERTYTINVVRQKDALTTGDEDNAASEEKESQEKETEIKSKVYQIGEWISGIAPKTEAKVLISDISVTNGTIKVLKAEGIENTGRVETGNKLTLYDTSGKVIKQYETLIYGDINGDGKVSNVDLVLLQKQLLKIEELSGVYREAANVSKDDKVSNKDLVMLQKHILNIEQISQ